MLVVAVIIGALLGIEVFEIMKLKNEKLIDELQLEEIPVQEDSN